MSKQFNFLVCFLIAVICIVTACRKDDPEYIAERDKRRILEYLEKNELEAYELDSGVFIVVINPGVGGHPSENSVVRMNYWGYLLDGTVFDTGNNVYMNLGQTVRGFQIGVQEFGKSGKGKILIPSALGYGERPPYGIPRNSVLIFDVEVVNF